VDEEWRYEICVHQGCSPQMAGEARVLPDMHLKSNNMGLRMFAECTADWYMYENKTTM